MPILPVPAIPMLWVMPSLLFKSKNGQRGFACAQPRHHLRFMLCPRLRRRQGRRAIARIQRNNGIGIGQDNIPRRHPHPAQGQRPADLSTVAP